VEGKPVEKPKAKAARVLGWMGEHVAGTVLGFAVTAALTAGVVWVSGKDKTEGQQIDQIRNEITSGGLEIRHFQQVSLHAGASSYLLTVGKPGEFEPDEIRIYDAEGESFEQRFTFDPEIKSTDSEVIFSPDTFEVLTEHDIDGDGQSELIGSYSLESATAFLMMPLSITWDTGMRQYQLHPLLTEDPQPALGETPAAREDLEPFESALEVTTKEGDRFEAWAAEWVTPLELPLYFARGEPLYLGASFPFPGKAYSESLVGKKLQTAYWSIATEPSQTSPHTTRLCWNNDLRLLEAEVKSGARETDTIARAWTELVRDDELARRGEGVGESIYVGFVIDKNCVLGE
jgi:hypothetical protein